MLLKAPSNLALNTAKVGASYGVGKNDLQKFKLLQDEFQPTALQECFTLQHECSPCLCRKQLLQTF